MLLYEIADDVHWLMLTDVKHIKKSVLCAQGSFVCSLIPFRQRPCVWSKEFWPPNSPDLNPLDYYVWSIVERVNKSRHSNVMSLRTAIEAAFVGIDSATLQSACEHFRQRIKAVIQTNGRGIYRIIVFYRGIPQVPCREFFVKNFL